MDYLDLDDAGLLARCTEHTYRASGPGGQKRNKTDSAVRLHLPLTHGGRSASRCEAPSAEPRPCVKGLPQAGITVTATESRSQHENRARALRRMRQAIALEIRDPVDLAAYRPSQCMGACIRTGTGLRLGRRDGRYNHVVRELLDLIAGCRVRLSDAAALLGITTANLTTFLRKDPKLLDRVNRMRRRAHMNTIR